jgi:lysophospholipase L1-like esterase
MSSLQRLALVQGLLAALSGCSGEASQASQPVATSGSGAAGLAAVSGEVTPARNAGRPGSARGPGGLEAGTAGEHAARPAADGGAAAAGQASHAGSPATGGGGHPSGGDTSAGDTSAGRHANAAGAPARTDPSSGGTGNGGSGSAGMGTEPAFSHACPRDGTVCKIMPFGDSITDGYNPDTPGGYRVELFRRAHSAGKSLRFVGSASNGPDTVDGVAFPRDHEGHSGWTIAPAGGRSGISTRVQTVMPQYAPDIVLLMIGTNDAADDYDMANAPARLGRLLDDIYAQLPDVHISVAQLIPSRGDGSQGDDTDLNARIRTFNEAIPELVRARESAGRHISIVDMYTPFDPDRRSLLEDEWHPNAAGYARIGAAWYAAIESLL